MSFPFFRKPKKNQTPSLLFETLPHMHHFQEAHQIKPAGDSLISDEDLSIQRFKSECNLEDEKSNDLHNNVKIVSFAIKLQKIGKRDEKGGNKEEGRKKEAGGGKKEGGGDIKQEGGERKRIETKEMKEIGEKKEEIGNAGLGEEIESKEEERMMEEEMKKEEGKKDQSGRTLGMSQKEKRRTIFDSFHSTMLAKLICISFILTFFTTLYSQKYVGILSVSILSFILACLFLFLFELLLKELQMSALLKNLKIDKLAKELRKLAKEESFNETSSYLNFFKMICLVGGPILGLALFFGKKDEMDSVQMCLLMGVGVALLTFVINFYRLINNHQYQKQEKIKIEQNPELFTSQKVLHDLGSGYLKYLQDFSRRKQRLLEVSYNYENDNYFKNANNQALSKRVLEIGISNTKIFLIPIRCLVEIIFVLLICFLTFEISLLTILFLRTNQTFSALFGTSIFFFFIFSLINFLSLFILRKYFTFKHLSKILFLGLLSSSLLPYRLAIFLFDKENIENNLDSFVYCFELWGIEFILKNCALGIFLAYSEVWQRFERKRKNTMVPRKGKKSDRMPESAAEGVTLEGVVDVDKKKREVRKDFSVKLYFYHFFSFIMSIVFFLGLLTLHNIPKTKFFVIPDKIFNGYLYNVPIQILAEPLFLLIWHYFAKKVGTGFETWDLIGIGKKFMYSYFNVFASFFFLFYFLSLFCFDVFFLLP